MDKKGRFEVFDNIFEFMILLTLIIFFMIWASFAQDQEQDRLNTEFSLRDADSALIGLLRTTVNAYLDGDDIVDAVTVADLISFVDKNKAEVEIKSYVEGALRHLCFDENKQICKWSFIVNNADATIFKQIVTIHSNRELYNTVQSLQSAEVRLQQTGGFTAISKASAFIPRENGEVWKVEFHYYE